MIKPQIDILLIDKSHYYDHTLHEINHYFNLLSVMAKVFFHDTNLRNYYFRKGGSMGFGWDNERGVIKAIEHYFNKSFNEKQSFIDIADQWLIRHYHYSCGFTILERVGPFNNT